ncbi:MAG: glycosyltransferase [Saprospiraceae bacterium]|nr:glycosyltransferase [Saprospiraceae bacterium]
MLLVSASVFLAFVYAGLLLVYLKGWRATPEWTLPEGYKPRTGISVLIPARNEADRIAACLRAIAAGSYPPSLLEIIVIDDFSDDATAAVVQRFQSGISIRLVHLSDILPAEHAMLANKKAAIEAGVALAHGPLIVTTDADCIAPADWLRIIASRFEAGDLQLLTAPVALHREKNLLQRFQSLDLLGLMGITAAGMHLGFQRMANGANLAYTKEVFENVGGYAGNRSLSSGDDMFLVQKIARLHTSSVAFLKNPAAAVRTEAAADLRSFVQQRIRWGTKTAALPEWPVRLVLLAVFLFCWSIVINAVIAVPAAAAGNYLFLQLLGLQLLIKAVFDYLFLREMCLYFGRADLLRWFVPCFLMHTAYVALIGAASLVFRRYRWKGRRVG